MVFLSYFLLEVNNSKHFLDSGLILRENIAHSFLFKDNYKEIKYYFFHTNINNNLILELNLLNEGIYQIDFLINDIKIGKHLFVSNQIILLENKNWTHICTESHYICILSFIIKSFFDDSILEIKIKAKNDENYNKNIIICLFFFIIIIYNFYFNFKKRITIFM